MKAFNFFVLVILLLGFLHCKKDKKESIENILPNGLYGFGYVNQYGDPINYKYKIIDNNIYIKRDDSICLDRIAGQVYKDENGSIKLTKLQIQGFTINYPCVFQNDPYGGDTCMILFERIEEYVDKDNKVALKGDCSILYKSGVLYGPFDLIYNKWQK